MVNNIEHNSVNKFSVERVWGWANIKSYRFPNIFGVAMFCHFGDQQFTRCLCCNLKHINAVNDANIKGMHDMRLIL